MIVTSITLGVTSVRVRYESDGDGGDPGFLTSWTVGTGVVLKWDRGTIVYVGFSNSFSVHVDCDKCRFI